jgi:Ser/Thr protein kinase RdoA (MazF antagonist)
MTPPRPPPLRGAERIASITPAAGGHIHDSFAARFRGDGPHLFLQRINTRIFPDPAAVCENIARVTERLRMCGGCVPLTLRLLATESVFDAGASPATPWCATDATGGIWRAFELIENVASREAPESAAHVAAVGRAIGDFHRRLAELASPRLVEVLPGFHDTPARLRALRNAVQRDASGRAAGCGREVEAIAGRTGLADEFEALLREGRMPLRPVHNDAKISNLLLDRATAAAACIVDLDTVMHGCVVHDFGDMMRSMLCDAAENADAASVRVRPEHFDALASAYLAEARAWLTPTERDWLVAGGLLITLEQAARFLTDHLDGDRYYRITRPNENLERARNQLALLDQLEQHRAAFESVIAASRRLATR